MQQSVILSEDPPVIDMTAAEFREAGHIMLGKISEYLKSIKDLPVTHADPPSSLRRILGSRSFGDEGIPTGKLINDTANLLINHSLFNGHPRFWGYITSSAAPIGALAELLAASINSNVGAYALSPIATEIEKQTIEWLGDFTGFGKSSSGTFVSGGNMANFIGFLAARKAKIPGNIRKEGLRKPEVIPPWGTYRGIRKKMRDGSRHLIYCAKGTHTWIQKAADLFGFGTDSIRWIDVDLTGQLQTSQLLKRIISDINDGHHPFLVIGNAGSVMEGAVDDLEAIAGICNTYDLWFHIDGAYGGPAAGLPENKELFKGLDLADSLALDPHKWLYSPIEAGCILVRDQDHLTNAFSFHPEYYNFNGTPTDSPTNFVDFGMQNTRGFKALKVWMILQQLGRKGITALIRKDIDHARSLYRRLHQEKNLIPVSQNLSIVNFIYNPDDTEDMNYLNQLNKELVTRLQGGGKIFLSNSVINGQYCLRTCFVNFRTTEQDIVAMIREILKTGSSIHNEMIRNQRISAT